MWKRSFSLIVQFPGQSQPLVFPARAERAAIRSARQAVDAGAEEARVIRNSDKQVVFDQVWDVPHAA
jgi:hypothetical protein